MIAVIPPTLVLLLVVTVIFVATTRKPGTSIFKRLLLGCGAAVVVVLVLFSMARIAIGPIGPGNGNPVVSAAMQTCRTLGLAMFQYANDNDGNYPDGTNSTVVFQKLVDGNYISDPAIFYIPLEGKTPAQRGERLKPENVCFDVTGGVTSPSPDSLPVVFITGYKVDYRPGGEAISLTAPYPPFENRARSWWHWLLNEPREPLGPFMAVCYHSNNSFSRTIDVPSGGQGTTRKFISKDFDAHGQTFRQLTPTGVLK